NASTFTFNKEDHTLGNLLSQQLLKNPCVEFAAYKIPSPHDHYFDFRVVADGTESPKGVVIRCCRDVVGDLETLKISFKEEWQRKKAGNDVTEEREKRGESD
ncbi:RBP11-like subunits of RNA polymerase, partial [Setomelanomma holmii]